MDGDPLVIRDRAEFGDWIQHAAQAREPLPTCTGLPGPLIDALDRVAGLSSVGLPIDHAVADAWGVYAEWYPNA